MDKQKCPECKATKYTNPSLKMMVNACGHALCENCVDILFARGSGACPQCKTPLRRGQFRFQMFEDSQVEKELDIRRRLMKDLNLSEDNFPSLTEYNDYLEFVESAVFSLANEVDVEATKRQLDEFKKSHADAIKSNRLRRRPELAMLDNVIEAESGAVIGGSRSGNGIDGVKNGDSEAAVPVSSAAAVTAAAAAAASTSAASAAASASGAAQIQAGDPVSLADLLTPHRPPLNGPALTDDDDDEVAAAAILATRLPPAYAAGGFSARLGLRRLLADAYCDLFYRL